MAMQIEKNKLIELYELMLRIHFHEEAVKVLFSQGKISGTAHLCISQEAVAAGVVGQLRPDDFVSSTHRGYGHMLAKGGARGPQHISEMVGGLEPCT